VVPLTSMATQLGARGEEQPARSSMRDAGLAGYVGVGEG
jgi:hypothetical protein